MPTLNLQKKTKKEINQRNENIDFEINEIREKLKDKDVLFEEVKLKIRN